MTDTPVASMIVRGRVIEDDLVEFGGRNGSLRFLTPDPHKHARQLPLRSPTAMLDLYELKFDDILDYLEELGSRLDVRTNAHLQLARELTYETAPTTKPIIDVFYAGLGALFSRELITAMADNTVGIKYLEGWVDQVADGIAGGQVRAFGARSLHVIAGNAPVVVAWTIARNAYTRGDCIIKLPSNDPFTGLAIGRTMCDMAPDHPITKHLSIGYWRGGDEVVESQLYKPHNIEKIVAWGGFDSVKHVTKYIQPGLELISLDPKYSISIVGADALADEASAREAALRVAADFGGVNQVGCANSRVVYLLSEGKVSQDSANQFGDMVYEELIGLPQAMSTRPKAYSQDLKAEVDAIRLQDDWYKVIGGEDGEGCVIVSQLADPVEFVPKIGDRTINIVPVDTLDEIMRRVDAYTQTVGVYPEALKQRLLNVAALHGAQRIVTLGHALHSPPWFPHDSIELTRRLCKWISNEVTEPLPGLAFAADRSADPTKTALGPHPFTVEALRNSSK